MPDTEEVSGRQESRTKVYKIPVRLIVANTNPRNPLSPELQRAGYTVFEGDKALWPMLASDDPGQRLVAVEAIRTYDPTFEAWAGTFVTQGQLQAVEVRDNGKRLSDGQNTYTLVYGCRRCLAILFNWALIGKPKEPVVNAVLMKGNELKMLHRAVVENTSRRPTVIEEARAIQYALNQGETEADVCQQHGISESTLKNRLALLDLDPKKQQAVHDGRLSPTKALAAARSPEAANGELRQVRPRARSRKVIEAARKEFGDSTTVAKVLDWVLGELEALP